MRRYCGWSRWFLGVLLVLTVGLAGCSHRPNLPPLAPVSGTVTLDGAALPGARVEFVPDDQKGGKGPPAIGVSDDSGHYVLTTLHEKGAAIGFHHVAVDARKPRKDANEPPSPSLVPDHYTHPETSKLEFEVKKVEKDQVNQIDLPLTSKQ